MCWVAEHWDDVLSDLSVFHRLDEDEIEDLTARQFWPRVRRLMHYDGAVRASALSEVRKSTTEQHGVPRTEQSEMEDPTPEEIRAMRDAARRRKYPEAQYGEMIYVSDQEIVRRAGTSA